MMPNLLALLFTLIMVTHQLWHDRDKVWLSKAINNDQNAAALKTRLPRIMFFLKS